MKITADGVVKVLDFGLAKATAGDARAPISKPLPTVTHNGTIEGALLGTPAYMSPEQARGSRRQTHRYLGVRVCALRDADRPRAFAATRSRTPSRECSTASLTGRRSPTTPDRFATPGRLFGEGSAQRLKDIGDVTIRIDSILSGSYGVTSGVATRAAQPGDSGPRGCPGRWSPRWRSPLWAGGLELSDPLRLPPGLRYSTITLPAGPHSIGAAERT